MSLSSRPPSISLRERNKRKTLAAIRAAAWSLFVEKGFERATTREIAERAGVGAGTVFLHARDKDELLVLVFHERVSAAFEQGFLRASDDAPLLDRLATVFGAFFDEYALQPALALKYLCVTLTLGGERGAAQAQVEARFLASLTALLTRARDAGETRDDLDAEAYARNLFALYRFTVLRWLAGEQRAHPSAGIASLRDAFSVAHLGGRPKAKKRATVAPEPERTSTLSARPGSRVLASPRLPGELWGVPITPAAGVDRPSIAPPSRARTERPGALTEPASALPRPSRRPNR
jgi:AcrR family transcriptional regulator